MRRRPTATTLREVADIVGSAAITLVGAGVLVLVAGMVALLVVLLIGSLYVPLRCRAIAWR